MPLEGGTARARSQGPFGLFYALPHPPSLGLVGDYLCRDSCDFGGSARLIEIMIFLETSAKAFLGLHLLAAMATLFLLFLATLYLFWRPESDWRLGGRFTFWGSLFYILTWVLGLLIYPVFRVKVRAEYFDPELPWATGLFEIKEHIGSLGLFAALSLLVLTSFVPKREETNDSRKLYLILLWLVFLITIFKAGAGFFLRGLKSI